jgi:hypothetical protein
MVMAENLCLFNLIYNTIKCTSIKSTLLQISFREYFIYIVHYPKTTMLAETCHTEY